NFIRDYDAGWLIDPTDPQAFRAVMDNILSDPSIIRDKSKNAIRLAETVFEPGQAVRPLVELIEGLT
ncbi:MAG: hypothetical protein O7G83_05820, partial [Proteobacteria bacterium]|nr:hypothetical protein [Pseudomonadota bacterium]